MELFRQYPLLAAAIGAVLGAYFLEFFKRLGADTYDAIKRRRERLAMVRPLVLQAIVMIGLVMWLVREPSLPISRRDLISIICGLYICTLIGEQALWSDLQFTWRLLTQNANPATPPDKNRM